MSLVKIKKILQDELAMYHDSHVHLKGANNFLRPVLLDLSMRKKPDGSDELQIVDENLRLVAAHADRTAILILDEQAYNSKQDYRSNVIYVVTRDHTSQTKALEERKSGALFPNVVKLVPNIGAALVDICAMLNRVTMDVTAQIDEFAVKVKEHDLLRGPDRRISGIKPEVVARMRDNLSWTYMATREIRIVGSFMHCADGLQYTTAAVAWHVNKTDGKSFFRTKIYGASKFSYFAMIQILNMGKMLIDTGYVIEKRTSRPAFTRELYTYAKDKHNHYKIASIPDSVDDILVVPYSLWETLKVTTAPVFVIATAEETEQLLANLTPEKECAFIRTVTNQSEAFEYINMISTRFGQAPEDSEMAREVSRLANPRKVHVFLDVIEDAY